MASSPLRATGAGAGSPTEASGHGSGGRCRLCSHGPLPPEWPVTHMLRAGRRGRHLLGALAHLLRLVHLLHVPKFDGTEEHAWGGTAVQRGRAGSLPAAQPPRPEEALTIGEELRVGLQTVVVTTEATRVVPELTVQLQLSGEGRQVSRPWGSQVSLRTLPERVSAVVGELGLAGGRGWGKGQGQHTTPGQRVPSRGGPPDPRSASSLSTCPKATQCPSPPRVPSWSPGVPEARDTP